MPEASYPEDLKYHSQHAWARIDGPTATVGISWHAQDQLGEIIFVEPPTVGTSVRRGDPFAEVESVKTMSDVIAPISGEVIEVNQRVVESPETINDDPYGDGWLARLRLADPSEPGSLMDATAYERAVS